MKTYRFLNEYANYILNERITKLPKNDRAYYTNETKNAVFRARRGLITLNETMRQLCRIESAVNDAVNYGIYENV